MSRSRQLAEHFFRHEYGRLVAMLTSRFGARHIETIEDAVQTALGKALDAWTADGLPGNPSAWLFRVARNQTIDMVRQQSARSEILANNMHEFEDWHAEAPEAFTASQMRDDLLQMLFACCDDAISTDAQLVLALKVLCGFDVREIAARLFIAEDTAQKRLTRARERLRHANFSIGALSPSDYRRRLPAVHAVIYLLFTEGYLSMHADHVIREELCQEAIRLATILVEHPSGPVPESYALLALMCLHSARLGARQDASGGLLLLEEQDRSLWNKERIASGIKWLALASQGETFSRYHAEAGVAAEHCLAPSFEETSWDRVAECYVLLEQVAPSAVHRLNRAVAVAEWRGAEAGLAILEDFKPPAWLQGSYLWSAVMADLYRRTGELETAEGYRSHALAAAPTAPVRSLLSRRLASIDNCNVRESR